MVVKFSFVIGGIIIGVMDFVLMVDWVFGGCKGFVLVSLLLLIVGFVVVVFYVVVEVYINCGVMLV